MLHFFIWYLYIAYFLLFVMDALQQLITKAFQDGNQNLALTGASVRLSRNGFYLTLTYNGVSNGIGTTTDESTSDIFYISKNQDNTLTFTSENSKTPLLFQKRDRFEFKNKCILANDGTHLSIDSNNGSIITTEELAPFTIHFIRFPIELIKSSDISSPVRKLYCMGEIKINSHDKSICDESMINYCAKNPTDKSCSCLQSTMNKPQCYSRDCYLTGYKTAEQKESSCQSMKTTALSSRYINLRLNDNPSPITPSSKTISSMLQQIINEFKSQGDLFKLYDSSTFRVSTLNGSKKLFLSQATDLKTNKNFLYWGEQKNNGNKFQMSDINNTERTFRLSNVRKNQKNKIPSDDDMVFQLTDAFGLQMKNKNTQQKLNLTFDQNLGLTTASSSSPSLVFAVEFVILPFAALTEVLNRLPTLKYSLAKGVIPPILSNIPVPTMESILSEICQSNPGLPECKCRKFKNISSTDPDIQHMVKNADCFSKACQSLALVSELKNCNFDYIFKQTDPKFYTNLAPDLDLIEDDWVYTESSAGKAIYSTIQNGKQVIINKEAELKQVSHHLEKLKSEYPGKKEAIDTTIARLISEKKTIESAPTTDLTQASLRLVDHTLALNNLKLKVISDNISLYESQKKMASDIIPPETPDSIRTTIEADQAKILTMVNETDSIKNAVADERIKQANAIEQAEAARQLKLLEQKAEIADINQAKAYEYQQKALALQQQQDLEKQRRMEATAQANIKRDQEITLYNAKVQAAQQANLEKTRQRQLEVDRIKQQQQQALIERKVRIAEIKERNQEIARQNRLKKDKQQVIFERANERRLQQIAKTKAKLAAYNVSQEKMDQDVKRELQLKLRTQSLIAKVKSKINRQRKQSQEQTNGSNNGITKKISSMFGWLF